MFIPCRCFSCGKPIGQLWEKYEELQEEGKSKEEALDEVGLDRYCCRSMFLSHVDIIDEVAQFKKS